MLSVYEAEPRGARPIVFIHGLSQTFMNCGMRSSAACQTPSTESPTTSAAMAPRQPLEADRYTNSSLWADDLAAVIQTYNLQRPVLVGWSYGGYVIAD